MCLSPVFFFLPMCACCADSYTRSSNGRDADMLYLCRSIENERIHR